MVRSLIPFAGFPALSPFTLFDGLERRLRPSTPALEAWTSGSGLFLRSSLPGLDPESIQIDLEEDRLRVRAKRATYEADGAQELWSEFPTGDVDFALKLPFRPEAGAIEARYELGILSLTLPRPEAERPHRIEVQSS